MSDSDARWNLRASVIDGSAWSVMVATGQENIVVFAVAIGLGDATSGLLASVPQVAGALLQLCTPWGVARLGSHRRWTVVTAFVQAFCFLPLIIAAVLGSAPPILLFLSAALFWFTGIGCGSSWSTFISQAVPPRTRARFFAHRMRVMTIVFIAATLLNGAIIEIGRRHDSVLIALAVLFSVAMIARSISAAYLGAHVEREPMPEGYRHVPLREFIARFAHGNCGRAIALLLAMQMALQISVPFLQPYLLRHLGLKNEFTSYGVVMASLLAGKILLLPLWGRIAHAGRLGRVLWIGCVGLAPVPAMWLFADALWMAVAIQLYTGIMMSAYEYAGFLRVLETVKDHERTSVMAWYQAMSSMSTLAGSLIGAQLLAFGQPGASGFLYLFIGATVARLLALSLLARATRDQSRGSHGLA